ncbi:peptidylprolyl isomerase [Cohnella silvisoli]|uniref:peptidylprolyl isomerase n=1 Tax=Cohnella silvisoli TaxID=2873699 RepID=A0ABV1L342_9BACL|nr:peptidyl-prolyl cis-trans isomerase [Cohnella silvisoli]MCD9025427.1 peptidyl-prolyl cis-trans isomerase [Cohnella silvisoli]
MKFNKKTRAQNLKALLVTLLLAGFITTSVICIANMNRMPNQNEVIATVNGEDISSEFQLMVSKYRAEVFTYFHQKYDVTDGNSFWTTDYDGEVPEEVLKNKALNEAVRVHVQFELAKRERIIADSTYKAFLNMLKDENETRSKQIENNQLVIGLRQFDEPNYLTYTLEKYARILKEKLRGKELKWDTVQLKQYFDDHIEKFTHEQSIQLQIIQIKFKEDMELADERKKKEAERTIREAKTRLSNGESFEDLMATYNDKGEKIERTLRKGSKDENGDTNLSQAAFSLRTGEISNIVESLDSFNILKCIDALSQGYMEFDGTNTVIINSFLDAKYTELVDELAKAAKVEIKQGYIKVMK